MFASPAPCSVAHARATPTTRLYAHTHIHTRASRHPPQALVVTLLTALPMLMHVVVLAALVYFAYGIVGVQAFEGVLRYT